MNKLKESILNNVKKVAKILIMPNDSTDAAFSATTSAASGITGSGDAYIHGVGLVPVFADLE